MLPLRRLGTGARLVLWLVTSLIAGSLLFLALGWLFGAGGWSRSLLGMWVYISGWILLLPFGATVLWAWARIDAQAGSIEKNWRRLLLGLVIVGGLPPMAMMWVAREGFLESLLVGFVQWLALLLPRLVVPGLGRGSFRLRRIEGAR